jgi:hypothetical protein
MAFDQTADQLLAAITVACLEPTLPAVVPRLFIQLFIGLQNRPESLKSEFVGLAVEAPRPFFAAVDSLLAGTEGDGIDSWLIDALRRAFRAQSGLELFEEWIVSPPARHADRFRYTPVEKPRQAYAREVCVARAVVGLPLAPLVNGLTEWALLAALRFGNEAAFEGVAPGPHAGHASQGPSFPLAEAPMALALRANDADPEELEREVLRVAADRVRASAADDVAARAFSLLLAVIASPTAVVAAEAFWAGAVKAVDVSKRVPLAPIYRAMDPRTPVTELDPLRELTAAITGGTIDPKNPLYEERLVLAARCDGDDFLKLAKASLRDVVTGKPDTDGIRERALALETWAVSTPSVFKRVGDRRFDKRLLDMASDPAVSDPENAQPRKAQDSLRPLDHLLEVLFAGRPVARYKDILLAIPWGRLPNDHWPVRPHRWRPALPADLVESLVAESMARLASTAEDDNIAGANLLEAIALHPVEALTNATVAALADLLLAQEAGNCRLTSIALAESAGSTPFALLIRSAGWTASAETDRSVATRASALLCARLSGHMPVEELAGLVLPCALPVAADAVADGELPSLAALILAAVEAGVTLSDTASAGADAAAELERLAHHYRMLPFEPGGAARLSARVDGFAEACFGLLTKEVVTSTRNSLCESLGTTLAAGMTAPAASAAEYVEMLMRRRVTPGRRLGARIVTAAVAVAGRQPESAQRLLDLLVLSTNDDEGLARLAGAVQALGDEALGVFERYVDALLASGRTVRLTYGLTLAGLLACRSDRLRRALHRHRHQGYLERVAENAAWIESCNDAARHWAERRLAAADLAAEYLALGAPSRPFASAAEFPVGARGEALTDALFRHRLVEKSRSSAGDGLFGLPKPPGWLFERRGFR